MFPEDTTFTCPTSPALSSCVALSVDSPEYSDDTTDEYSTQPLPALSSPDPGVPVRRRYVLCLGDDQTDIVWKAIAKARQTWGTERGLYVFEEAITAICKEFLECHTQPS